MRNARQRRTSIRSAARRTRPVNCWLNEQGDVLVEYLFLTGAVSLVVLPAMITAGTMIVAKYDILRTLIALPVP
jgi:hypothetical protein